MEIKAKMHNILDVLQKYKFIVLILLIGFIFLTIPERAKSKDVPDATESDGITAEISLEQTLKEILSQIRGAGKVEVMLTISEGEEIVFQTNETLSSSGDSNSKNSDTVTVTDANKNHNGLIRKINPPVYQGAIIVCQGADNPSVKLAITEAVSKITGLGTNCISVLKMK